MDNRNHLIETAPDRVEQVGEVELIGNWAEVALDPEVARLVGTGDYMVFVSSYEPVLLYVQNRTPLGFEIHALPVLHTGRKFSIRCSYHVMASPAAGGLTSAARTSA